MKKLLFILCLIALSAATAEARPHGWPHRGFGRPPVHFVGHGHHRGHNVAAGFAAGIIGGGILGYLASGQTRSVAAAPDIYTSTTVYTTPSVYTVPTVVNTQIVSPAYQTCYTNTNIVTGAVSTRCSGVPVTTQIITAD